ncbi:MAG TPA: hypothetical protein VN615_03610 [Gaiellales bacterium]|nr:hypothetical protein [Gaiellales bacterium]
MALVGPTVNPTSAPPTTRAAPLPASLDRAVDMFAASAFCHAAFGDLLVDTVTELGRPEVARFAAHVTDRELDRYRDMDQDGRARTAVRTAGFTPRSGG